MFCKNCGKEQIQGQRFCTNCGCEFSYPNMQQPVEPAIEDLVPAEPDYTAGEPVVVELTPAQEPEPEVPVMPEAPVMSEASVMPEAPAMSEAPVMPEVPVIPEVPVMPEAPAIPEAPVLPETPTAPEQESKVQKKKSHKGLIVTLACVGAVIALLAGGAFLVIHNFDSKLESFSAYSGKRIIAQRQAEYDDLLTRAEEARGIVHIFDTFSIGGEIDDFDEYINARKEALPTEADAAYATVIALSEEYYIDNFGDEINKLGGVLEAYRSLEDASEELIQFIEDCEELRTLIVTDNEAEFAALVDLKAELDNAQDTYPTAGDYQGEIEELCASAGDTINTVKYKDVAYYKRLLQEIIDELTETSRPYWDLMTRKDDLVAQFDKIIINDTESYAELLSDFDAAYSAADYATLEQTVDKLGILYSESLSSTSDELNNLYDILRAVNTDELSTEDFTQYDSLISQIATQTAAGNFASAYALAQECYAIIEGYVSNLESCTKLLALADAFSEGYLFYFDYPELFTEADMYYVCENTLKGELHELVCNEMGWTDDEAEREIMGQTGAWENGFTREHCEELAYQITGRKHYFYADCGSYADDYLGYTDYNTSIYGEREYVQNSDGTITIITPLQVVFDSEIYRMMVYVKVAPNPDSIFDGYSIVDITTDGYSFVDYQSAYLKAIDELSSQCPDDFGDDEWSKKMSLIDVNGDGIPELYVSAVYGADCEYLINYQDNGEYGYLTLASGDGFSEYIPGEGLIRVCDGRMGGYTDCVYRVRTDSTFEDLFEGQYLYPESDLDADPVYSVKIPFEKDDVTPEEYYSSLDSAYLSTEGTSTYLSGEFTASQMKDILLKG